MKNKAGCEMCDCLYTVPKLISQNLQNQGIEIHGMPYIASRECFKGDFYYSTVFLETVLFQKYKKRNGEIGTKKVKRPLIPKFCPFCGEMYVSDKKDDEKLSQAVSNDSWVSIKERLPNKDGKYLVHYQTQVPCDGKYLPKFDVVNYSSCIRHFDFYHNHITHWQALPNPPVQKEQ